MANGRGKKRDTGRDSGPFVALPWSVLDSEAYKGLTVAAKALMMEVARQYHRDDNGRMVLSLAYLNKRGWYSAGVIQKAKHELVAAGLIFETVKGCRPNRASWYAATWLTLDKLNGYDLDAERLFKRGAYRLTPAKPKRAAPSCKNPKKNARLIPPAGIEKPSIVPPAGIETPSVVPPAGTIRPTFDPSSIPPAGIPLEVAIYGDRIEGVAVAVDVDSDSDLDSKGQKTARAKKNAQPEKAMRPDYCKVTRHGEQIIVPRESLTAAELDQITPQP